MWPFLPYDTPNSAEDTHAAAVRPWSLRSSVVAPATAACAVVAPAATAHTTALMLPSCGHLCHGRPAVTVLPRYLTLLLLLTRPYLPCGAPESAAATRATAALKGPFQGANSGNW